MSTTPTNNPGAPGAPDEALAGQRLKSCSQVDGKVVRYPTETYAPTTENPRALPGPHEHRRKLWRVDGPMSDEQWTEVVGLFFRNNELIGEHFKDAFAERA